MSSSFQPFDSSPGNDRSRLFASDSALCSYAVYFTIELIVTWPFGNAS
ncbi:MAG TPA: hypothetical protein VFX59_17345 [Polyangiales bacterium]|nr:hypothetical protein [Polyangiales bacterium]